MKSDWLRAIANHPWAVVGIVATYLGSLVCFFVNIWFAIGIATVGLIGTVIAYLGNVSRELADVGTAKKHEKTGETTLELVQKIERKLPTPQDDAKEFLLGRIIKEAAVSAADLEALLAESDVFLVYVYVAGFPPLPASLGHTRFYPEDLAKNFGLVRLGKRTQLFAGSWSAVPKDLRAAGTLTTAIEAVVRDSLEREWIQLQKSTKRLKVHAEITDKTWEQALAASIIVAPVDRGRLRLATIQSPTLPTDFFNLVAKSLQRRGALTKVVTKIGLQSIVKTITLSSLVPGISEDKATALDALQTELLTTLNVNTVFDLADQQAERLATFTKRVWPMAYEAKAKAIIATSRGYREAIRSAGVRV